MTERPGIEVRPVRDSDRLGWERVAHSSDDAWLGHSWDWNVEVEERVRKGERRSVVMLHEGEVVGIFPQHLHLERHGLFVRRVLYSNHWIGGGIALSNEMCVALRDQAVSGALRATNEQAKRDRVDKMVLMLPTLSRWNLRREPPHERYAEFADRSAVTDVILLAGRSADDVWAHMEGRGRTKARRAERAEVRIVESPGLAALDTFYDLHLSTYRRNRAAPQPRALFEAVLRSPHFTTFFAEREGRPIAAVIVALYCRRAQYFASASLEEALHIGANNLLQWHALRWLVAAGAEAYELGAVEEEMRGADAKMAGIAQFLRSFGGDSFPTFAGEHVYRQTREKAFVAVRSFISGAASLGRPQPLRGRRR